MDEQPAVSNSPQQPTEAQRRIQIGRRARTRMDIVQFKAHRPIFDEDLSELSSNADSEKRGHKYDDWECGYDESDEELWGSFRDEDLDYQFRQAKASRDKHKRQLRKNKRRDEAAAMSAEYKEKAYDEARRDLLLEIGGTIRDIKAAATSADREVSNKILCDCSYRLVPAAKLRNEHLAMTIFNSTLSLNTSDVSEHRKPSGTKILELVGYLTVNGKVALRSGTRSFLGPDRTGKMVFTTEDGHPGAVSLHALDEADGGPPRNEQGEKPELEKIADPNAIVTFYGIRSTPRRNRVEEGVKMRLYVEKPQPRYAPRSPRETYFELNHPMGAYYDSRYSEFF
ncbi:hypothetical protein CMUS01_00103 [Colletotrichum musicola]|uniref:Uncharacterized protein n=1 Tax=Colletotrichum musicola TaxID=2175873 RepID=A0A8H6P088_9PEZI|nr:hypothetical protein CMUS01_00103 [Colletotrichum musicola]